MKAYSETGQFTPEQIKLAKKIYADIKRLRKSGCSILAKQDKLYAYLKEDLDHSTCNNMGDGYETPHLECGCINDSGADDTEYFERGYITED